MNLTTYIWDMDGTLINSYPAIIKEVMETLACYDLKRDEKEIYDYIVVYSVKELMQKIEAEERRQGTVPLSPWQEMYRRFHDFQTAETMRIDAMPNASETLAAIVKAGGRNLVFTHRGKSAQRLLDTCGLAEYIDECLSVGGELNIPRKPAPGGIEYLIDKHGLKKEQCCYVGDRMLDMESAKNAGVTSILYDPFDVYGGAEDGEIVDVRVRDLMEIVTL